MAPSSSKVRRLLLAAFLFSGAAALVYEVVWTRALSLLLGSTTYAVSTMLATFMAGLAGGAWLGGRWADRGADPVLAFGLCELGIGVTGILSVPLLYALPRTYLGLYRGFHLVPPLFFFLQVLLCAAVMAVPTLLMGATFPLVARAITERLDALGRRVGSAYSLNTIGAVLGSLAAGFLLVPRLGLRGAVLVAGLLNLAVGMFLLLGSRSAARRRAAAPALLFVPAILWALSVRGEPWLVNFYTAHRASEGGPYDTVSRAAREVLEPLSETEHVQGRVVAFRGARGHLVLQVDGKIEGTGPSDLDNTLLLAYLPLAAHLEPRTALVIGLGAGVTLAAVKENVADPHLVEIHPGVLEAVRRWGPPGLLAGVRVFQRDARHFLFTEAQGYDVITSEPSYPTDGAVGSLFTQDFFRLVAQRLREGGVVAQWLPYHMLTNDDVTMMVKTFGSIFPHTILWRVPAGLDLILLGSRQPFSRTPDAIRRRVAELHAPDRPLSYELSRGEEEVAEIVRRSEVPVHTDDRPRLEFVVVRNLLAGDLARLETARHPTR